MNKIWLTNRDLQKIIGKRKKYQFLYIKCPYNVLVRKVYKVVM